MLNLVFKGGWLMIPIFICSLVGLAILINKFFQFRGILKALERPLEEIIRTPPEILLPLLKAVKEGGGEKELAVVGTRQVREMEKGLSWLSLIATIAPLLGLTGTVTGMIKAFMVIAVSSSQVSPALLASGIWEALITTAAGLLVAIPIHIGHHFLEKQADEIAFDLKDITLTLHLREKNGI